MAVTEEVPFKIQIVEPKVAAGAERLDEPEDRRRAEGGLHGADHRLPALQPAGRRLGGRGDDPGEGRTRPPAPQRERQRAGAQVEDRGDRGIGHRSRNGPVWVSSQLATLEIAPPFVAFAMERAARRAGQGDRGVLQGAEGDPSRARRR